MACIITPYHKTPITHVGISASQNVYTSANRMVQKEARSFAYYIENGLMPSLKFKRATDAIIDGYDENKAMFPVYEKVPLFAITTIAALESGMDVSVVGSRDVGIVVDELKKYYTSTCNPDTSSRLKWVPECDGLEDYTKDDRRIITENRKSITLNNSMSRLVKSMHLSKDEAFLFVAGDIIFYNYLCAASDPDIIHNSLVADFNGLETINPPLPRNYYHRLRTRDGKEVHFKEPNVWAFGSEFNLGVSNDTYNNAQKGGFGLKTLLKMAGSNIIKNLGEFLGLEFSVVLSAIAKEGFHFVSKNLWGGNYTPLYREKDLERLGRFVNMTPIRIKTEHSDYLRLKDVDALHDYVFIKRLIERHHEEVFPKNIANSISGFASFLEDSQIVSNISTLAQIPERINGKVRKVQETLRKKGIEHDIPLPFNPDGSLAAEPREDENLEAAVQRSRKDLEKFKNKNY